MKIRIKNFGPLNSFEFDLNKRFVITYGNNNIGKSYAMQIVYLLIKTMSNLGNSPFLFSNHYYVRFDAYVSNVRESIYKLLDEFMKSSKAELDITQKVRELFFVIYQNMIMPDFINSCDNTFGNFEKILEQSPKIEVEFDMYKFCIDLKSAVIRGDFPIKPIFIKKTHSDRYSSRNNKSHFDIYVCDENYERPMQIIYEELREILMNFYKFFTAKFEQVYFLPASRSGIYSGMNAFGSIIAELSKNRAMLTRKIELPGISEPISDYFIALSNIKPRNTAKYQEYYSKIENDILKGVVTFDRTENALVYTPNDMDVKFEMTEVSSMVSEISPIVAFLKYILGGVAVRKGTKYKRAILFIEEPEAHLHPNNQIKLIEIFAELATAGVNLVISSHSNYIFNKINNLILSKKLDYNIYQAILLEQTSEGSIGKNLVVDELGAVDRNFADVNEKLYQEREDIINNLMFEEE